MGEGGKGDTHDDPEFGKSTRQIFGVSKANLWDSLRDSALRPLQNALLMSIFPQIIHIILHTRPRPRPPAVLRLLVLYMSID
jgi:hypothetical protein